jgi:hypothetical protein
MQKIKFANNSLNLFNDKKIQIQNIIGSLNLLQKRKI